MAPVKIHVVYCGGWGYKRKVDDLARQLESAFADYNTACELTSESTPGITGWLEVTVNGNLVHSKKSGDGYIDSDKKLQKIIGAVSAAKNA